MTALPADTGTPGEVSGGAVTFTPAPDFSGTTSFTYRARDGGPDTIAAQTRKFVRVRILSDRIAEPREEFTLRLGDPDGAAILDGSGTGTILPPASP